jgi:hypothetical protein
MKIQITKKLLPRISTCAPKTPPLAERIMRWGDLAEDITRRFSARTRFLSPAGIIFLRRQAPISLNRLISYWRINWQPIVRLRRRDSTLRETFTDRRYYMAGPVNRKVESRNNAVLRTPGPGSQEARQSTLNVKSASRGEAFTLATLRILSGMTLRSHELTKFSGVIHRQNDFHFKKREIITRQFIEPRQRVEVRLGDRKGMTNARRVLRREESLREIDLKEPSPPVFHKSRISHEARWPEARQVQLPATPSNAQFGIAPPQIDLNQITDQVIRQLDRRMVIWRERNGYI